MCVRREEWRVYLNLYSGLYSYRWIRVEIKLFNFRSCKLMNLRYFCRNIGNKI